MSNVMTRCVGVCLAIALLVGCLGDEDRPPSVQGPASSASVDTDTAAPRSTLEPVRRTASESVVDLPNTSERTSATGAPKATPAERIAVGAPAQVGLVASPTPASGGSEDLELAMPDGLFAGGELPPPVPVEALPELQAANAEAWSNDDGSVTVTTYSQPTFFQPDDGDGAWVPIDTTLEPDPSDPERVRSAANEWVVSFGPTGSEGGFQRFEFSGGRTVSFDPVGALASAPQVDGSSVRLSSVWPSTDLEYEVSAVGVDERIVIRSAEAPASFAFEVDGAVPVLNGSGGVDLMAGTEVVAVIPPMTVDTATQSIRPREVGGVFDALASDRGGRITVSVDAAWLASLPLDAFPVVIDPTVFPRVNATMMTSLNSSGAQLGGLRYGVESPTRPVAWRSKAYVSIPDPATLLPGGTQPWRLVSASLRLIGGSGQLVGLSVFGQPVEPIRFSDIGDGTPQMTYLSDSPYADVTDWVRGMTGSGGAWYGFKGV